MARMRKSDERIKCKVKSNLATLYETVSLSIQSRPIPVDVLSEV